MSDSAGGVDSIIFILISLLCGIVCRMCLKWSFVPYSAILLLIGILFSVISEYSLYK